MLPGCGVVDSCVSPLPDNTCKRQAAAISCSVIVRETFAGDCDICTRVGNASSAWSSSTCSHCSKSFASKEEVSRRSVCGRRASTNSIPYSVTVVQNCNAGVRYTKDKSDKYGKKIYNKCIRRENRYQKCGGTMHRLSHQNTTTYCNTSRADEGTAKLVACFASRKPTECIAGAAMTCLAKVRCVLCGVGLNKPVNSLSHRVLKCTNEYAVYSSGHVTSTKLVREHMQSRSMQRVDDQSLVPSANDTGGKASDSFNDSHEQKVANVYCVSSKVGSHQSSDVVRVGASAATADARVGSSGHGACSFDCIQQDTNVEKQYTSSAAHSKRIQLIRAETQRRHGTGSSLVKQDAGHSFVHTSCSRPVKLSKNNHGCTQSSLFRSGSSSKLCSGSHDGTRDLLPQDASHNNRSSGSSGSPAASVGKASDRQLTRGQETQQPADTPSEFSKYSVNKKCGMLEYSANKRCDRTPAARVNITAPAN